MCVCVCGGEFSWGCFKGKNEPSMKCSWKCLLWRLRLKLVWVFIFRWHIGGWLWHWLMLSVSQAPFLLCKLWFLVEPGMHKSDISASKYFQVFFKSSKSAMGISGYFFLIYSLLFREWESIFSDSWRVSIEKSDIEQVMGHGTPCRGGCFSVHMVTKWRS